MEIQNNNNKNYTIYDEGKGNIYSLNNSHRTKSSGKSRRNGQKHIFNRLYFFFSILC